MKKINPSIKLLFLSVIFITGCIHESAPQLKKVGNVVRVMVIERRNHQEYILYTRDPNSKELVYNLLRPPKRARIIADVPVNEDMWVLREFTNVSDVGHHYTHTLSLEIHVHSGKDINGSTFEEHCGKNCIDTVNTQVIE